MTVFIDSSVLSIDEPEQEGRIPCELTAITYNGATIVGEGWSLGDYTGALYNEKGTPLSWESMRLMLLKERAQATWSELQEAGLLDELLSHSRLLDRLLDALATVPLLKNIIAKLRETE